VFSDQRNHASLIDGMRLSGARKVIYPHLNLNALEDALRLSYWPTHRRVIVTKKAFCSMDGDIAPLVELANLAEKYNAALILRRGPRNRRSWPPPAMAWPWPLASLPKFSPSFTPCGKALGSAGAFVCGPRCFEKTIC